MSNKASHTSGPWYTANEMIMALSGAVSVADCFGNMKGHLPLSERQANARLIAAAPCQNKALVDIEAIATQDSISIEDLQRIASIAFSAIAKAKGE